MRNTISKLKIPTPFGLGIIILGITIGVYLVAKEQVFLSQATPSVTAQNITVTNITKDSVVISWQTNSPASSFITYGQTTPNEQTSLDDRDSLASDGAGSKPRLTHYVTLKNLLPQTKYQFKIISGKVTSDVLTFETAKPLTNQTGAAPIIGSVLDNDTPLEDGIVYLSIPEAATQSALIKSGGNFLIPLSEIRKADLSDYQLAEGVVAKLTIQSDKGEANILLNLQPNSTPLPVIKLGQNIDLTTPEEIPLPSPNEQDLNKYDLNGDGKINAADNAIILKNFGKSPKDKKSDINKDGIINQKDLDLMSQKLTELGAQ